MENISIVIPARNEERFILGCLKSLAEEQNFPKDKLEILVVDGDSEDRTKEIVEEYIRNHPDVNIKILRNENKFTSFGLNIGIKAAKGEIIIRADAHTQYPPSYIATCLSYLEKGYEIEGKIERIDNVGGIVVVPSLEDISNLIKNKRDQIKARAIAISISHPFGAASAFRLGSKEPRFVDTVFGGCYRKEIFNQIGFFNEKLKRSQDLEFNLRLIRNGGKILLVPTIQFKYYPKLSFREFFKHNFIDGMWAIYPIKFTKKLFKLRHYIPLFFVLALPFAIWPYFFFSLFFSFEITRRERDIKITDLILAFATRHFGYGFGSLWGLIKIIL